MPCSGVVRYNDRKNRHPLDWAPRCVLGASGVHYCTDYEQRIIAMTAEMMRMREDMHQRTVYMTREMQRYQAAAIGTSQAMMAAKKEMQDRRNDIDAMRAKLDTVMERLYVGEGHNLTLQATIATAQDHAGAFPQPCCLPVTQLQIVSTFYKRWLSHANTEFKMLRTVCRGRAVDPKPSCINFQGVWFLFPGRSLILGSVQASCSWIHMLPTWPAMDHLELGS
jgi:hypothetical protein